MTITSYRTPVAAHSTPPTATPARVALTGLGLALAVIVGWDGSAAGRVIRVVVVGLAVAGAVLWVAEARQQARGWIQVVAGVVGVVAGLGIGLPHLTHGVFDAPGIAGMVALVAGGWLLVVGTVELLRVTPGWRKLLAVPLGLLIAVFVLYPVPMALYATNLPKPSLDAATPADRGLTFFDAQFTTDDGVELSGWYIPSHNGGAVVLAHGASATRSELLDYAAALSRHGFGVLLYDARGHGRSGGRAMEYGWLGDHDVSAAITYASKQLDVHPGWVGAVGVALGADQVLGAAATDERIKAVVADGATGRAMSDSGWLPKGPLGWVRRGVDAIAYGSASLFSNAAPPQSLQEAVAGMAPRPVLLVAGDTSSAGGEESAARWIQEGSPRTTQLWLSPGADRGAAFAAHPQEWEAAVARFLTATLLK
jgi:uncharacterized protein